ncbi:unnamed protein product [Tetraodon nigroviridis]|uniref:(spotted green pufferfish) hypothetical protein n=1 Tax=Tetraodon nigroviridis TaxID=99883 RepID=Q4SCZ4_TETNG|nr:unnamed protein product [Tetraodon nigroviridis]
MAERDTELEQKSHDLSSPPEGRNKLTYLVTDAPPWYLCIFLAIQHLLTAFGATVSIPLILSEGLCLQYDKLTQSHLINSIFFVSGLCTLLQVTFGVRLPILQGGTFSLLTPTIAMLSMPEWECPAWTHNASLVDPSSPIFKEVWQSRLRNLQGSIMVASLLQIVVGFSGIIGFLMRFIGPLTIAPTITLIGLSLFESSAAKAGTHWGISAMTTLLIILFSQYLRLIPVPLPAYDKTKKLHMSKFYIFQRVSILLGIVVSWLICYILTVCDVLPSNPARYGHLARTDVKENVVSDASWFTFAYPGKLKSTFHFFKFHFYFFYHIIQYKFLFFGFFFPGQWGMPTVSLAGVFGLIAGIICSMAESVGDYHACAKLSGAPPPPKHAINRGIGVEGLGSLLAGAFGTGNGTTSFSENVAVLGITKVGSRRVIFLSGVFMILIGVLGKISAVLTTIPDPVVGGMFMVMFGVITATGISNLQHYLTAFGAIFSIPLILSESLCLQHDGLTQSRLINTIFLVSGICTMMQVAFGVRLPILQGGTFALLTPAMAMLSMPEWECPAWTNNASLVDTSSPVFIEVWQSRLRALQGSIMVASLLQIVAGFTGIIGFLMPLHWAFDHRPHRHAHWPVSYLHRVPIPVPAYNKSRKLHISKFHLFQMMPWGMPTVSLAGVFGLMAGIICSMAESVGDYHACAKLSGAPPPPKHAINRGIGVEGLGSLLAGAFGTGNGTTSFSENVAILGITKVGSRMVIFTSGVLMVLMGILGKIGAVFTTIPEPVVGGMFLVMFGVISAAGVSNLQVKKKAKQDIFRLLNILLQDNLTCFI